MQNTHKEERTERYKFSKAVGQIRSRPLKFLVGGTRWRLLVHSPGIETLEFRDNGPINHFSSLFLLNICCDLILIENRRKIEDYFSLCLFSAGTAEGSFY